MTTDRIERVQQRAREHGRQMQWIRSDTRAEFAEADYMAGVNDYGTLTGAEWDEAREKVARTLMKRADLVNLGAAGDWYTAGHTIKEDFRGHAEAAMRALRFKREGE